MTARRWGRTIVTLAFVVAPSIGSAGQNADSRASRTYARAVELEAQGNHAAALSLLWEAAGLAPKDADIQNRLGEAQKACDLPAFGVRVRQTTRRHHGAERCTA
jgi:hypothetical protein